MILTETFFISLTWAVVVLVLLITIIIAIAYCSVSETKSMYDYKRYVEEAEKLRKLLEEKSQ